MYQPGKIFLPDKKSGDKINSGIVVSFHLGMIFQPGKYREKLYIKLYLQIFFRPPQANDNQMALN